MKTLMSKSFTGTPGHWAPLVLSGQAGCGKTTLTLLFAAAFGAEIAFKTTTRPREPFDPAVDWDVIDALVIDEITGWDSATLRAALPALFAEAKSRRKGVVLVGQSMTDIADVLPSETCWFTPMVLARLEKSTEECLPVVVEIDGKRFLDFSRTKLDEAAVLDGRRRAPHGFILPAGASAALANELAETGHEVRWSN